MAVGGRRDERGPLAHDAQRDRFDRPVDRRLRAGDADPANEGGPPRVGALLRATGSAVEQERIRDAGEATEAPLRRDDADLDGRGSEVDGDEGAGIGGHEAEW